MCTLKSCNMSMVKNLIKSAYWATERTICSLVDTCTSITKFFRLRNLNWIRDWRNNDLMDDDWVIIAQNNSMSSLSCTLGQTYVYFLYTTLYSLVLTAYFHKTCTVEGSLAGNNRDDRILLTCWLPTEPSEGYSRGSSFDVWVRVSFPVLVKYTVQRKFPNLF